MRDTKTPLRKSTPLHAPESQAPAGADEAWGDPPVGSLPLERLLCIARQRGLGDPVSCAVTLGLLSTSRIVRLGLHRIMKPLGLSEARFLALVTLYSLDPEPSTPANLAFHAEITRTAMTDTLDLLERQGCVRRERNRVDRRAQDVHLTEAGRQVAESAIRTFLVAASDLAIPLNLSQRKLFDAACRVVRSQAAVLGR